MNSVVILICSLTMAPGDCNVATALDVLNAGEARTVASCGLQAQATLARTAVKPDPDREYAKVECGGRFGAAPPPPPQ